MNENFLKAVAAVVIGLWVYDNVVSNLLSGGADNG